jgi:hypothetical protein
MGWLWESEPEEQPRRSGLRLVLLGGLASLTAVVGVLLISGKGADPAAPTSAAQLDCASPRDAWRAACRPAIAEALVPVMSAATEEAPKTTDALSAKMTAKTTAVRTARASSKPAKPDTVPVMAQLPVEEVSRLQSEGQPLPARATTPDGLPSKAESAAPSLPEPRMTQHAAPPPQAASQRIGRAVRREPTAMERGEKPAKLARHRAKRIVVTARDEPYRPSLQAEKSVPESRPAYPRARFRQPGTDPVALPDGRRVFVAHGSAGGRDAYRASQWKVTTYRDSIDW